MPQAVVRIVGFATVRRWQLLLEKPKPALHTVYETLAILSGRHAKSETVAFVAHEFYLVEELLQPLDISLEWYQPSTEEIAKKIILACHERVMNVRSQQSWG